jgi:diguanylate cyclase (GGDEF)-like protein
VIIDLDHFKTVNDQHGHQVGDQALRQVASALTHYVRPYDWASRWGGEEFLIMLPGASAAGAATAAERIRLTIAETPLVLADGATVILQASLGVACTSAEDKAYLSLEQLVQKADEALYQAKREGRNRVCLAQ